MQTYSCLKIHPNIIISNEIEFICGKFKEFKPNTNKKILLSSVLKSAVDEFKDKIQTAQYFTGYNY